MQTELDVETAAEAGQPDEDPTTQQSDSPALIDEPRAFVAHPLGYDSAVVFDFGSQTSQLIVRRVREAGVYCELLPWDATDEQIRALDPRAIILSGGPASVYEDGAPTLPPFVLESGLPVLGICYGMQLLAHNMGGQVSPADHREYGPANVQQSGVENPLLHGLPDTFPVWMSHGDRIEAPPAGFVVLGTSANAPHAAMGRTEGGAKIYGIQFHPEVVHTPDGAQLLKNFLFDVAGLKASWTTGSFVDQAIAGIRAAVGDGRVLCGLSGGVDSAVVAALLHRAVGSQLTCIFVDTGLLRLGEADQVMETFGRHMHVDLRIVNAEERFLARLAGVTDPEEKRKRIGAEFIRVFEEAARGVGQVDYLAQGTLYPDVIESSSPERKAAVRIKTHHNVGGLPADMQFKLIEPLRYLFKDEARAVGSELGLPDEIVWRQPFPGPGLAVRVLGEVRKDRLDKLRSADAIMRDELKKAGLEREIWQSFAVLTNVQSVGVMGDYRTYSDLVAIRAVTSVDGMTADWARVPYDVLGRISNRIVNEVPGVNRVVYDITSKPPATIEWE